MARRRQPKALAEYSWALTNAIEAVQGEMAFGDTSTGLVTKGGTSTTLIFIGFFAESMTGDGETKVRVKLPVEVEAEWLTNDVDANAIDATDRFNEVYVKDGKTVSTLATGRSKAGRVLDFDATGDRVLVAGGLAITGPTGAGSIFGSVADRDALTATGASSRTNGQTVLVRSDDSLWRFDSASTAGEDENQMIVCEPDAGTGRWIRADKTFIAKLAITKDTADAVPLLTVPAGFALRLSGMPFWDVTTGFSGGTNSAIGLSASAIATTKGDLLGGAAGQLTAVLGTAGIKAGTIGPLYDSFAEIQAFFLKAADYLRFDAIASAYAAGVGFICVPVHLHRVG